jgi:predicted DNA-binding antitoxin AbrB/MazE fold protein
MPRRNWRICCVERCKIDYLTDLTVTPNIAKEVTLKAGRMVIEAKYENGVFRPLGKVKLKEGTVVEIHVDREETHRMAQSIRELGFAGM